jgi:3-deoxy-D-manno-octulosonic-acid transferase
MGRPAAWQDLFRGQSVFIGASLWDADFRGLQPAIELARARHPDWRWILVPHEPEGALLARIETWFRARGWPVARWSSFLSVPAAYPVDTTLVVDRVGMLAELYAIASLVFVGGSFRARVHNVLEPAAYGRPILTGPYIHNSREAQEMASGAIALQPAPNAAVLSEKLLRLIEDEAWRGQASAAALAYLEERQGAAAIYADRLLRELKQPPHSTAFPPGSP